MKLELRDDLWYYDKDKGHIVNDDYQTDDISDFLKLNLDNIEIVNKEEFRGVTSYCLKDDNDNIAWYDDSLHIFTKSIIKEIKKYENKLKLKEV